jgi:tRNA nucleotidyltransferase (CCA-adding enzyme)
MSFITIGVKMFDCDSELIESFVSKNLLSTYKLHGVLLVGSVARGYAIEDSDVDLMAFYDSNHQLNEKPYHAAYEGVRFTLEHHDINQFYHRISDFK